MIQKRPFQSDSECELSDKHPRYHQPASFPDAPNKPQYFGGKEHQKDDGEGDEKLESRSGKQFSGSWEEFEGGTSTSEEHSADEAPLHGPVIAELFDPEHQIRTFAHVDDIYHLLLEYPPRKPVSVGPDHQAELPVCNLLSAGIDEDSSERFLGSCVIPMPDTASPGCEDDEIGKGRYDCDCDDQGSVRCVKQHIGEERERVRNSLGQGRFTELGFCEMGEFVAERWTELDEQLFHNIVFSNPASVGKNFWVGLSAMFPSRSKKEIVSYYFNVFMLRRRTEQNRCIPLAIDSDDDEWPILDEPVKNESETSDQDECLVKSPCFQEDFINSLDPEANLRIYGKDDAIGETCINHDDQDGFDAFTELACGTVGDPEAHLHTSDEGGRLNIEKVSQDVRDGSDAYTELAAGTVNHCHRDLPAALNGPPEASLAHNHQEPSERPEAGLHNKDEDEANEEACLYREKVSHGVKGGPDTFREPVGVTADRGCRDCSGWELAGGTGCRELLGTRDVITSGDPRHHSQEPAGVDKPWDSVYRTSCKTRIDLSPTCSMIKEVFGEKP